MLLNEEIFVMMLMLFSTTDAQIGRWLLFENRKISKRIKRCHPQIKRNMYEIVQEEYISYDVTI